MSSRVVATKEESKGVLKTNNENNATTKKGKSGGISWKNDLVDKSDPNKKPITSTFAPKDNKDNDDNMD